MTSLNEILQKGHRIPDHSELAYHKGPHVEDAGKIESTTASFFGCIDNSFTLYVGSFLSTNDTTREGKRIALNSQNL